MFSEKTVDSFRRYEPIVAFASLSEK